MSTNIDDYPGPVAAGQDAPVTGDGPGEAPASGRRIGETGRGDVLVEVRDLKVHFPIKRGIIFDRTVGHVKAVDGMSMTIRRGETYGLVGESGCGKSTFGRALLQLEPITEGTVHFDGKDLTEFKGEALRKQRRHMQMVFQDPMGSLDPRQTVESLLYEGMSAHNMTTDKKGARRRLKELLHEVGLPASALGKYPHEFSGGQRQRIGIARALALDPELIVADEPVSALDVSVQAQVINLLRKVQKQYDLTYLVIAHDLAVVRHISDTVGVMYLGGLVEEADAEELYTAPLHPYTRALMSAVPVPDPVVEDSREQILLQGDLPSPANPPSGCRFRTRCPFVQEERCSTERPELRTVDLPGVTSTHRVACHYVEQIFHGEIQPHAIEVEAGPDAHSAEDTAIQNDDRPMVV